MTPVEHDEILLELEATLRGAQRAVDAAVRAVRISAGQRRRGGNWIVPDGSVGDLIQAGDNADQDKIVRHAQVLAVRDEALAAIADHETAYTGWPRFRLVISSDGHVHGDSKCRSFRPTTETVVIPALSGKTATDAVAMLGNACCSVCLPKIPGAAVTKIPASLVGVLVRRGSAAFHEALERRKKPLDILR